MKTLDNIQIDNLVEIQTCDCEIAPNHRLACGYQERGLINYFGNILSYFKLVLNYRKLSGELFKGDELKNNKTNSYIYILLYLIY